MASSPYEVLGVPEGTSKSDCKAAYRKLLAKWHPDRHDNDPFVVDRFRDIKYAWDCIENDRSHAWYQGGRDQREPVSNEPVPSHGDDLLFPDMKRMEHMLNTETPAGLRNLAHHNAEAAYSMGSMAHLQGLGGGLLAIGASLGWMIASPGVLPGLVLLGSLAIFNSLRKSLKIAREKWMESV